MWRVLTPGLGLRSKALPCLLVAPRSLRGPGPGLGALRLRYRGGLLVAPRSVRGRPSRLNGASRRCAIASRPLTREPLRPLRQAPRAGQGPAPCARGATRRRSSVDWRVGAGSPVRCAQRHVRLLLADESAVRRTGVCGASGASGRTKRAKVPFTPPGAGRTPAGRGRPENTDDHDEPRIGVADTAVRCCSGPVIEPSSTSQPARRLPCTARVRQAPRAGQAACPFCARRHQEAVLPPFS